MMQIEFNMVDLVSALDVVAIVSPRGVTASGAAGYLFVVRDNRCYMYSRDNSCVAMSHFPLISSDGDGQFVYPAEYINGLKLLAATSDTCKVFATNEEEKFTVRYESSSGAKAERSSFDPNLLVTCDKDLADASGAVDFSAGLLREAILQARPFLAKDANQDESFKGLQVLDATKPEYAKGNGCLFVSDGVRTFYFQCAHLADKSLEVHGQHLAQLLSFLGKSDRISLKRGQHFTFASDAKGNVFGWPKHAKSHSKFGYYPRKSDTYVLRIPKVRLANSLEHARSELESREDKIKINFDADRKILWFGVTAGTAKVEGIPVPVDVVEAESAPWSFGVNINHMIEMVSGVKGNEIELRVRIIPAAGDRRTDMAMFRTLDKFLLNEATGKVTTEPEGAVECEVTRFMPSKG
jgi:hypothetical protein